MTCPLRSTAITAASALLRGSPPLSGALVLSASRLEPLAPFPLASPARLPSRWGCYHAPPLTDPYVPISSIRFFTGEFRSQWCNDGRSEVPVEGTALRD